MSVEQKLDLRPGEWVEVLSEAEVLATLDDTGALDGLPFMPEMLRYCGRRLQVEKRADRTCDAVSAPDIFRGMQDTVHLRMVRCDGSAHGGCQAGCLMFWKEAWLRRSPSPDVATADADAPRSAGCGGSCAGRDLQWLIGNSRRDEPGAGEVRYRCQATDLRKATCPLLWWQPKQYVDDVRKNKVPLTQIARSLAILAYNKVSRKLTGRSYPHVGGSLRRTPVETLGLQPGEWIEVKSKEEIVATLDASGKNRGLTFEAEMLPYCGRRYRVLRRVERIIEEASGRMLEMPTASVILEEVICANVYRRACSRSNYLYWREIWLRRVEPEFTPAAGHNDAAETPEMANA